MERDHVTLDAEQLAKHAMRQAYESRGEYDRATIGGDLDLSLYEAHNHITDVDEVTTDSRFGPSFSDATDEKLDGLRIHAELSGYVSEKVRRATRLNPPEYKQHDVTVHVTAWWFPRPDQLAPLTAIETETVGGIPSPPDPEPYDDRR